MPRKKSALHKFLKTNQYTLLSLVVILGMFVVYQLTYEPGISQTVKGMAGGKQTRSTGEARIGGEFEVVDHNGNPVTQEDLKNQFSMIFFGFTFCPDVCPMSLSKAAEVYEGLTEKQRKEVKVYFVTVDPERDTAEIMKEYVGAFHDDFTGLTGTNEQIKNISKKYLVYAVLHKEGPEDKDYVVDHSSYFYIMGPDGKYLTHFRHKDTVEEIAQRLQQYLYK